MNRLIRKQESWKPMKSRCFLSGMPTPPCRIRILLDSNEYYPSSKSRFRTDNIQSRHSTRGNRFESRHRHSHPSKCQLQGKTVSKACQRRIPFGTLVVSRKPCFLREENGSFLREFGTASPEVYHDCQLSKPLIDCAEEFFKYSRQDESTTFAWERRLSMRNSI